MASGNDGWRRGAFERDFLYQRRLVSVRPFVADDGAPGLGLWFEGNDMIAMRIEGRMLGVLQQAIGRLLEDPRIGRQLLPPGGRRESNVLVRREEDRRAR